jgi:endonuclease YncB( thermonuclease family)
VLRRVVLIATAAFALLPAAAAEARRGPCLVEGSGGPRCHVWNGKVKAVHDGDTFSIRIAGRTSRVRLTGVNAMEQRVYSSIKNRRRGDCHALEATERIEGLIRRARKRVRVAAQDPSSRSSGRLRRSLAVRLDGRWIDLGRVLVQEGHALWLPAHVEDAWNARYGELAQRAEQRGLRLYDSDYCRPGPDQDVPLKLVVNWDADGQDGRDVNGEWAAISNQHPTKTISLGGWWFRDSALRRYVFPKWAAIAPGETIRLHVGRGEARTNAFFWGLGAPAFENSDDNGMGDGGYLYDPEGDLRAWMTYPCRVSCTDPLQGKIELHARPKAPESVTLTNTSDGPVSLDGYRLDSFPDAYYLLDPDLVLQPGETLRIDVEGDPDDDTRLVRHWGKPGEILANRGDRVSLQTFSGIRLACDAWGSSSC